MLGNKLIKAAAGNAAAEETDEHFQNTVLLLHGDGNQGATNFSNTGDPSYLAFKDNSSNNFPITVNGDAYGDNFGPYALGDGYWGVFSDGSGDYLSIADNAAFDVGTGDFTIECFVYHNNAATSEEIYCTHTTNGIQISRNSSGKFAISQSGVGSLLAGSTTLNAGTFYHVAAVRSGTDLKVYVDGVEDGSTTNSTNLAGNSTFFISANAGINGYLSNLRLVKGTAITPPAGGPTSPLTAVANTSLLACQSSRFVDNSTNNFSISVGGGTPKVTVFNPFGEVPDGVNGSGYFDGSGDWLKIPSSSAFNWNNTSFTIQGWFYATAQASPEHVFASFIDGSNRESLYFSASTTLTWWVNGSARISATNIVPFQWNHFGVSDNGGTTTLYVNGVSAGTWSSTYTNGNRLCWIATYNDGVSPTDSFTGYVSGVQIIKGTAIDFSSTGIPTSPLTAVSGTELLTCQYAGTVRNVGFIDSGPYDFPITRVGNTTQGTFSPFSKPDGAWSNYFNRTDYQNIRVASSSDFNMGNGAGNFTIEFFLYLQAGITGTSFRWVMQGNTQGGIFFYNNRLYWRNGADQDLAANVNPSITTGVWYHFAFVRSGSTYTIYKDGVSITSGTGTASSSASQLLIIGTNNTYNSGINGYLSSFRFTRSAVYTTDFTPPSEFLTTSSQGVSSSDVKLLTCQSNRFVDNSVNARAISFGDNASNLGTRKVTPFSPFPITTAYDPSVNGGAAYFDGSGDSLTLPSGQAALQLGSSDFSVDVWVYKTATNVAQILSGPSDGASAGGSSYTFYVNAGGTSDLYIGSTGFGITSPAPAVGQWAHVAFCRTGGTYSSYLNGVRVGTRSDLGAGSVNNGNPIYLGGISTIFGPMYGYLSDVRLIKGSGGYDATSSTITIPTAPLTAIANTSLLCNFTNAGILDNTCFNALETVGNAQVDTSVVKYGTGAMKFDGVGDYLQLKNIPDLRLNSSEAFTIEFWVNPSQLTSDQHIFHFYTPSGSYEGWAIGFGSGGLATTTLGFYHGGGGWGTIGTGFSTGTWYHIAITSEGTSNTGRFFVNGSQTNSGSEFTVQSGIYNSAKDPSIGAYTPAQHYFIGFLDDVRITKGVARYTSAFTPPTKALPNIGV